MARQFARKGSERPQLVHSARVSLLARIDKYNDPKNLEWEWDDVTDKWERHALSAVQDLVAAESERDEMREQFTRLREIAKGALQFRVEVNGPCNHGEYMTKLCTQCEIREALAQRNTGGK